MSENQTQEFQAVMDTLHCMMQKINENGKATQSQIDEVKSGIYMLEERVTQLESTQKSTVQRQWTKTRLRKLSVR